MLVGSVVVGLCIVVILGFIFIICFFVIKLVEVFDFEIL